MGYNSCVVEAAGVYFASVGVLGMRRRIPGVKVGLYTCGEA